MSANKQVVFGSLEAEEILRKDKELARLAEEREEQENPDSLAARLEEIDSEIDDLEMQLAELGHDRREVQMKLDATKRNSQAAKIEQWNSWATGVLTTQ